MNIRVMPAALWLVAATTVSGACAGKEKAEQVQVNPLTNPSAPEMNQTAPDVYRVKFETSTGDVEIEVTRAWSPRGADRFYNLVTHGWFDEGRFFRVVPKFMVQFGINGDPAISKWWRNARIADDSATQSNKRGTITFATSGVDSRTTQVFINFVDNTFLDKQGFTPFGRVVSGMDVVDRINPSYREQPVQGLIQQQGNTYLQTNFPQLDYIKKATIVQ
jgi:peptidyl-prolyl cis-trans isomerase A (cyclophilin A)